MTDEQKRINNEMAERFNALAEGPFEVTSISRNKFSVTGSYVAVHSLAAILNESGDFQNEWKEDGIYDYRDDPDDNDSVAFYQSRNPQ